MELVEVFSLYTQWWITHWGHKRGPTCCKIIFEITGSYQREKTKESVGYCSRFSHMEDNPYALSSFHFKIHSGSIFGKQLFCYTVGEVKHFSGAPNMLLVKETRAIGFSLKLSSIKREEPGLGVFRTRFKCWRSPHQS